MPDDLPKGIYHDFTPNNKVKLVRGGKEYFELLIELIRSAKDTIHLQTYIFDDDETGTRVADALKESAQRKVQVYLMVDGYASQVMSQRFIRDLRAAGINFLFFEPLYKSKYFYFSRRLHHKLLVADTRCAIVGGVNITNRYNDMPDQPAWLDFALYVEGDIVKELCVLCWKTWEGFPSVMKLTPCEKIVLKFEFPTTENSLVRMRRNDSVRRKNQVSRSYIEMFQTAQSDITLICSYFLPGRVIRRNILRAVNHGVKVKVVMAGISDIKIAKQAERYFYNWLLHNKVEIYEYQGNVLHGKIAVCDNEWLTIGSYNVNNISAYASIELNLDVRNPVFVKKVKEKLDEIITKECVLITESGFAKTTNIFKRFIRWGSYEIIRIVFSLFTFYFRPKS